MWITEAAVAHRRSFRRIFDHVSSSLPHAAILIESGKSAA
jgi:hypothetical protein